MGRAPVSKTGGCRFDSCRACKSRTAWCGSFSRGESLPPSLASGSRHYRSIPAGPVENAKPRSELCPCEASCLQARREPTELPLLVQGKPALSDGLQVGHWPDAFDVHADPTPRGHGIQADTLRMRGVELQAGPAEARRQLGLAARPIPEVQHLRLHAEARPTARPQGCTAPPEENSVCAEAKQLRALLPLVSDTAAQPPSELRHTAAA